MRGACLGACVGCVLGVCWVYAGSVSGYLLGGLSPLSSLFALFSLFSPFSPLALSRICLYAMLSLNLAYKFAKARKASKAYANASTASRHTNAYQPSVAYSLWRGL